MDWTAMEAANQSTCRWNRQPGRPWPGVIWGFLGRKKKERTTPKNPGARPVKFWQASLTEMEPRHAIFCTTAVALFRERRATPVYN
ncbi:MAG TPA: hypothetical protein VMR25_15240, partial [Planctomycetaceae bacterium]|nr:hypothetical protein [Planctomycetaceae bacterium]